jgi:hypothetical protein
MSTSVAGSQISSGALPQIRAELQRLYRELDQAVARHHPVCALSGRCCKFKEYDHTLFLSAPEALLLVADSPLPARELDAGETCPWQDERGHCTAREARPLGCRIFYCDPGFESTAPEIAETFISRLKRLTDTHHWPWNYAPLHQHLHQARAEGRLHGPSAVSHD